MIKKDIKEKDNIKKKLNNEINNDFCCENIHIKNLNKDLVNLKKKIKNKNIKIIKLKSKIKYLKKKIIDKELRFNASIDNLRKSNEININKIYKYSLEKFSKDLINILDNLESAIKISKNDKVNYLINYKGIKLTLKNFISILDKFGIKKLCNDIDKFDPNYHQAMSIVYTYNKKEDNKIIEILQHGYIIHDRLLRPTMVKVLKYKKNNNKK